MTSLSTFVTPHAIHMMTDGQAYTDIDPLPVDLQKVAIFANLPAIISLRGGYLMLPSIIATVSQSVRSFDEFLDLQPNLLKAICRRYWQVATDAGDKTPQRAYFNIAGWSAERDQLEAYAFASEDLEGIPAWRMTPVASGVVAPWDKDFAAKLGELHEEDLIDHPETVAVHLMETQRSHLFQHADTKEFTVGGDLAAGKFAQLTTLTRNGISTRIVKRWEAAA